MISKTKISKRIRKKTNPELVESILLAKKNNLELAKILSSPARKGIKKNLDEIDQKAGKGETVIVPGKVLGKGQISKKIKIVALSFSSSAEEKLKKAGCEISEIRKELKKNKKLEGKVLN